jgi:hypothetical protein
VGAAVPTFRINVDNTFELLDRSFAITADLSTLKP